MKPIQFVISLFLGFLGIVMIIEYWGNLSLPGVISFIVGIILTGIGVAAVFMYIRAKKFIKLDKQQR